MSKGLGPPPPALLTRIVSPPNASTVFSTTAERSASCMTLQASPIARPPAALIAPAAFSAASHSSEAGRHASVEGAFADRIMTDRFEPRGRGRLDAGRTTTDGHRCEDGTLQRNNADPATAKRPRPGDSTVGTIAHFGQARPCRRVPSVV